MRQTILILLLLTCLAFASASWIKDRSEEDGENWEGDATIDEPNDITIKHHDDGNWSFGYKTSNNIEVHEESESTDIVKGEYSYVDPDGRLVKVTYIAGAGIGFVPYSNVIDDAIMKSIELNLKNPPENFDSSEEGAERKPPRDYSFPTFAPKPRRVPAVVKTVDKGFETVQKVKATTVRNLNRLRKVQPKVVEEAKVTVDNNEKEIVENVESPQVLENSEVNVKTVENVKIEPTIVEKIEKVEDEVKVAVDDLKTEESLNDAIAKNVETGKAVKEAVVENLNRARKVQSRVLVEAKKFVGKVSDEEKVLPEPVVKDEVKIVENLEKVEEVVDVNLKAVKKVKEAVVEDSHRFGGIRRKIANQVKTVEETVENVEPTTVEIVEETSKKTEEPTTVKIEEIVTQKPAGRKFNRVRKIQSTPTVASETDLNITQNVQNAIENRLNTANNVGKVVVDNVRNVNQRRRVRPQPRAITTTTQVAVTTVTEPAVTTTIQPAETTTIAAITEPVTDTTTDVIVENIKTADKVRNVVVKNVKKLKTIPQDVAEEVLEVLEKSVKCDEKQEVKINDPCEKEETIDSVTTTEESTTMENLTTLLELDATEPSDIVSTTETPSSSTSPLYFRSRGKFRNRNL